jgi:hypothetical protein
LLVTLIIVEVIVPAMVVMVLVLDAVIITMTFVPRYEIAFIRRSNSHISLKSKSVKIIAIIATLFYLQGIGVQ